MFGKILGFSTPLFICKKKLSMYACVTKVIPEADLMIHQRSQAIWFKKFKLETNKMTAYETRNSILSIIINKQSYDIN
ncbi:unnamed protein product [Brassica oleracea var. botrytis]|uniref:Uncharacterized protein n=1 Tax=Brassica oleracea TaxID=3712 RepID=A0A3P6ED26_BRAOL|nr:unnamed protein product [Brassica oleracea]